MTETRPFTSTATATESNISSPSKPLFLHVPVSRLIVLSIVSFSLYEVYWIYKNWHYIKERDNLKIHPFWRGMFGLFYCHSLLRRMHSDPEARSFVVPTFSPGNLATGWVVLIFIANAVSRAPGLAMTVVSVLIPSFLCLVPVQNYVNEVARKRNPAELYHGWSAGHIVCLVFGIILWGLVLLGATME